MNQRLLSRVIILSALMAVLLSFCGCSFWKRPAITDDTVTRYARTYKMLKVIAPNLPSKMHADPSGGNTGGMEGFSQIEGVIKEGGFKNYQEFVEVNAVIGYAFSQLQAKSFMSEMEQMHQIGDAEIEKSLNDPAVPDEVKKELREKQKEIRNTYTRNKKYAKGVQAIVEKFNEVEVLEVVARHREELLDAFAGVKQPDAEFFGHPIRPLQ